MAITLEPMDDEDFEFRWQVFSETIKPYIELLFEWTQDEMVANLRANLAGSDSHSAIMLDGVRVGIVQISERDGLIGLDQLEILPAYQGRGIGTAVIRSLMDRADKSGNSIQLSVFHLNIHARNLYTRLGFVPVSETERDVQMRYTPPDIIS